MNEYNLARAFKRIEEELIKSMIRNFEKHKAEETEEGFNWDQWQVVQLRELERYRKKNREKFTEEFEVLNGQVEDLLRMTNDDAQTETENRILDEIKRGNFEEPEEDPGLAAEFFTVNENKLNALIETTTEDLEKAEHSVLRRSNDIYRQVINNAQVYATSGGTYEQAVDMATKDFARRGITSIVYKNGSRHSIRDYSEMAIRTAAKRAYLMGEGKKQAEYGIHTVRVNKRTDACPLCLRWTGKVLIDDVYGGGTKQEAREKRLPLLSTAMAKGFLHPNCKDVYSIYFPGISKPAEPWSEYDLKVLADKYNYEQKEKHAKTMLQGWQFVAETRLDPENKRKAEARAHDWEEVLADLADTRSPTEKFKDLLTRIKDLAQDIDPVSIYQVPGDYGDALRLHFEGLPEDVKNLILKYDDKIKVVNYMMAGPNRHARGRIRFNIENDFFGVRGRWTGIYHETGHALDLASGGWSKTEAFENALRVDYNKLIRNVGEYHGLQTDEVYEFISSRFKGDEKHAIMDLLNGLSRGKIKGKWAHPAAYWDLHDWKVGPEAFAHFFEALAREDQDKLRLLRSVFPTAFAMFTGIINKL